MRVLQIRDRKASVVDIDSTLESLQGQVGGLIEAIYPFDDPVALICNEEGKILGLPGNIVIKYDSSTDVIAGNCLICGLGPENFTDLPEDMISKYMRLVNDSATVAAVGGRVLPVLRSTKNGESR